MVEVLLRALTGLSRGGWEGAAAYVGRHFSCFLFSLFSVAFFLSFFLVTVPFLFDSPTHPESDRRRTLAAGMGADHLCAGTPADPEPRICESFHSRLMVGG